MKRRRFIKLLMSLGFPQREARHKAQSLIKATRVLETAHANHRKSYEEYYCYIKDIAPILACERAFARAAKKLPLNRHGKILDLPRKKHESNRSYRKRLSDKIIRAMPERRFPCE